MVLKVIKDRLPHVVDEDLRAVVRYAVCKSESDKLASEMKSLRPGVEDSFDSVEPDDEGHRWLDLPGEPGGYARVQYQRRVSNRTDQDAVERILSANGLTDRCTTVESVVRVDEEEIMRAMYEGLLSEEEVSEMFPQQVTHAVVFKRG